MLFTLKHIITRYKVIAITAFCCIILLLSKDIGFFWDNTLLCSKMGHYLYNNNLFSLNFPENFDPGHPPLMAFIYAVSWKILGKTLLTSHLLFSVFLFGFVWQLHNFVSYFTQNKIYQIVATAFVFCDPTILAQTFYIGQEIPQFFFFLLALNQLVKGKCFLKCIALFFLSLCSVRGMMLCAGFFIFEMYYYAAIQKQFNNLFTKKNIMTYAIAASGAIAFLIWRRITKGYLFMHEGSQWAELGQIATFKTFIFNVIVTIHRFLDFGRAAIALFVIAFIFCYRNKLKQDVTFKLLLSLTIFSTCIITIVSLAITNTIGHRYFAISFVFMHLLALYIINTFCTKKAVITFMLTFCLVTGNLWQYPVKYAQGWDASLRCLPYFNLRNNAINYLNKSDIKIEEVATFFPNIYSNEEINLNNNNSCFAEYDSTNKYIFLANIYNLKPQQYQQLYQNYTVVKRFENWRIWVEVLKKR